MMQWLARGGLPALTGATVTHTIERALAPLHQLRRLFVIDAASNGQQSEQIARMIGMSVGAVEAYNVRKDAEWRHQHEQASTCMALLTGIDSTI
jgi:DNA-directed RNA polymerase specialized sigma24 family protein